MTRPAPPPPPRQGPLVRVTDVHAAYGIGPRRRPALRGVDLELHPGTVTGLVGPNGAGKTSLLRALAGFLPVRRGEVTVGGLPPHLYRRRHGVGFLPEYTAAAPGWTTEGVLRRSAILAGAPRSQLGGLVEEALAAGGLTRVRRRLLPALSRGQLRRLALSQALLHRPALLLLDEPLSALDPPARVSLRRRVLGARAEGVTVLLSTHDLAEVEQLADQVLLLRQGRVRRVIRRSGVPGIAGRLEELFEGDGDA